GAGAVPGVLVCYAGFGGFNLFVPRVFWARLADRFSSDQGKRFFALISVGGTAGAIFGPWLAGRLAEPLGTPALLLVAAGFLMLALVVDRKSTRLNSSHVKISYAVFCLKKKTKTIATRPFYH